MCMHGLMVVLVLVVVVSNHITVASLDRERIGVCTRASACLCVFFSYHLCDKSGLLLE